MLNKYV